MLSGIQRRITPKEYPKLQSAHCYFREWRKTGLWKCIHDTLRLRVHKKAKRHKYPTAGCIDSQNVESTLVTGIRGYDAGKHVNGRKRHLLVDTLGLVLSIVVTAASVSDPAGARQLLSSLGGFCKILHKIWADVTYRGELLNWVEAHFRFRIGPALLPDDKKDFNSYPGAGLLSVLLPDLMPIAA